MKTCHVFVLVIGLLLIGPCASEASGMDGAPLSTDQMLSIAGKQHDIAKLLIKEGRFERVLPEMRKILDLNLQDEYEELVAKSSGYIAYLLGTSKQYALGHELLEETLARVRQCGNFAALLQIKAHLYKSEGKNAKAIETLERSVEIERQCGQ